MQTNWILVADSSRARIFEREGLQQPLREVQDFNNSAGHASNEDLETDAAGRFSDSGQRGPASSWEPAMSAVEHENELFALSLAQYLDKARVEHRYDRLSLIAAPKFLGLLHKHMKRAVQKVVEEELPKSICKMSSQEIDAYLRERIGHA